MEEEPSARSWRRFARLKPDRKKIRRRARKIESATLKHAHRFIIRRWENVKHVRRFALGWLLLVGLLIGVSGLQMLSYRHALMKTGPVSGGTYAEAVTGPLETINPLFAATSAEQSASRLIFASLLSYDSSNHLRGELAASWRSEEQGKRYIVDLRQDLMWHDGQPLTADDVVFTVERIKNPLTRANQSLYRSWTSIKVSKLSDYSLAFDLSAPYAPFPHALTFGILPKHLLGDIKPESLREADFNRSPVGAGPYAFSRLQVIDPAEDRLVLYLNANQRFVRGTPKIDRFQLHVFRDSERIRKAFLAREVNAGVGLTSEDLHAITERQPRARVVDTTIYDGVYSLLRTDSVYLQDRNVREALRVGLDRKAVIEAIRGNGKVLEGPLLPEQVPSLANKRQPAYSAQQAATLLDTAGWQLRDGKRYKEATPLSLIVVAPQTGDYPKVMEVVAKQWRELGIEVETQLVPAENLYQNVLLPRMYDVLIYELALGADPDVYPYWHSSQADPRLRNLSNYRSTIADEALASAQTRSETSLRNIKYETFVDTWLRDVPAIALYKPTLHYITTESVRTLPDGASVPDAEGRYSNVELWTVESGTVYNTP